MKYRVDDNAKFGYGSFEALVRTANKSSFLSPEEEVELFTRYKSGDNSALDRITRSHLRLVLANLRKFEGYGLNKEELIQEGCLGIVEAAKNFDVTNGARFTTFASYYVRSNMMDYIQENFGMVKVVGSKNQRKIFFNMRRMVKELLHEKGSHQRNMSTEEIEKMAAELDVKPDEIREMMVRMSSTYAPIDSVGEDDDGDEGSFSFADTYVDPNVNLEDEVASNKMEKLVSQAIPDALSQLKDRSADIMRRRWLTDTPMGLQELGDEYGCSAERIRQIEKDSFKKMKKVLNEYGIQSHV